MWFGTSVLTSPGNVNWNTLKLPMRGSHWHKLRNPLQFFYIRLQYLLPGGQELSNYLYKEKTSLPHQENWNQVKIALCKFPTVIFVWNFSANVVKKIWDLIRVVYTLYHLVHFHKIWSPFFCWDEWIIGLLLFLLLLILVMDSISF